MTERPKLRDYRDVTEMLEEQIPDNKEAVGKARKKLRDLGLKSLKDIQCLQLCDQLLHLAPDMPLLGSAVMRYLQGSGPPVIQEPPQGRPSPTVHASRIGNNEQDWLEAIKAKLPEVEAFCDQHAADANEVGDEEAALLWKSVTDNFRLLLKDDAEKDYANNNAGKGDSKRIVDLRKLPYRNDLGRQDDNLLNHVNLSYYDFRNCKATGVNFRMRAERVNFGGMEATGAYFAWSELRNSMFKRMKATDADFSNSVITGCIFLGADLTGCDFARANMQDVMLVGSKFKPIDLEWSLRSPPKESISQLLKNNCALICSAMAAAAGDEHENEGDDEEQEDEGENEEEEAKNDREDEEAQDEELANKTRHILEEKQTRSCWSSQYTTLLPVAEINFMDMGREELNTVLQDEDTRKKLTEKLTSMKDMLGKHLTKKVREANLAKAVVNTALNLEAFADKKGDEATDFLKNYQVQVNKLMQNNTVHMLSGMMKTVDQQVLLSKYFDDQVKELTGMRTKGLIAMLWTSHGAAVATEKELLRLQATFEKLDISSTAATWTGEADSWRIFLKEMRKLRYDASTRAAKAICTAKDDQGKTILDYLAYVMPFTKITNTGAPPPEVLVSIRCAHAIFQEKKPGVLRLIDQEMVAVNKVQNRKERCAQLVGSFILSILITFFGMFAHTPEVKHFMVQMIEIGANQTTIHA